MRDATKAIAELTTGLQRALGEELVSLMLYGSVARGTAGAHSDVNVLLVLKDATAGTLQRAEAPLAAWAKAGYPPPLIQTEAEWAASADVFPIEVEDIREAHRLLAGRDVVSSLRTSAPDVRAELEREARGKLIRLRAEYAVRARRPRAVAELLARALGTFLVLFRAALRLAGRAVPTEPAALARAAGELAGFDASAFDRALQARAGVTARERPSADAGAAAYLAAVEKFVAYVNDLDGGRRAGDGR